MKAAWYEAFGEASTVLTVGTRPDPTPGEGEVVVALRASGINPSDVKLRAGARPGTRMAWPAIIPHSDGAGEVVAVGAGVDASRIGERVWIWNGQWQRASGTAAELIAIPSEQAVRLPEGTSFEAGACFGIPALTAWRTVYADGPVDGKTVLVTGGAGTVGRYAIQMARLGGARVITTVSSRTKAVHAGAEEWINYRESDVAEAVMSMTGGAGVDRIIDVDFGANQAQSLRMIREGGVVSSYASAADMKPTLDFYGFMFRNVTLQMVLVYLLDPATRRMGEASLSRWLEEDSLTHAIIPGGRLDDIAAAHETVEAGEKLGTVVLSL